MSDEPDFEGFSPRVFYVAQMLYLYWQNGMKRDIVDFNVIHGDAAAICEHVEQEFLEEWRQKKETPEDRERRNLAHASQISDEKPH